jgi:hypothetical protein
MTLLSVCRLTDLRAGDAFIKYFTSSYLFLAQNIGSLHDLHQTRTKIISNESLRGQAYSLDLPSFMNVRAFSSKMWRPQNHDIVSDPPKSTAAAASVDELSSDLVRYAASPTAASSSKLVHGAELTQNIGNKVWLFISLNLQRLTGNRQPQTPLKLLWARPLSLVGRRPPKKPFVHLSCHFLFSTGGRT